MNLAPGVPATRPALFTGVRLMTRSSALALLLALAAATPAASQGKAEPWPGFEASMEMIPMRDGVKLFTSVYVPKDPAFRCDGKKRHPFEQFRKVTTASFLPNSLFAFLKTEQAFHGVEVIKREAIERKHGRHEAVLYLRALLTGRVR